MSDQNTPVRVVKITAKTAAYIAATAGRLWRDGTGTVLWDPETENFDPNDVNGLIENISNEDGDTYYWATQLLSFARFVAGVMANAESELTFEESNAEDYP